MIKRIISSDRREWIVVTSDRDIASHAWSSGSIPISTGDFLMALEKEVITSEFNEEGYDEEYSELRRKGNPRKLSKKEKAIRRALSKL